MKDNSHTNISMQPDALTYGQQLKMFRSIVAHVKNGVVVQQREGKVELINQAAADMLGIEREAVLGRPLTQERFDIVDIDGNIIPVEKYPGRRALHTGQPLLGTVVGIPRSSDAIRWLEIDSYPVSPPGADTPQWVFSSLSDITTQTIAISALEATNRRTQIILSEGAHSFRVLDWYGNVMYAVPPVTNEGVFGTGERVEVDGLPQIQHLSTNDHARVVAIFERVRETDLASETADFLVDAPIAGRRWFECTMANHLGDPAVGGVVVSYRDISARKEAENEIRFQADLLARAGQAIIATDERGHIVFWNQTAVEIYGWSAEAARDQLITDVIKPWSDDDAISQYGRATARCQQWWGDFTIWRHDGVLIPIFMSSTPIFDTDGDFIAVVGVATDTTERKASELALAYQARHDLLTGLPNFAMLMHEVETHLLAFQNSEVGLAALFVGLDRFKVINEGTNRGVGDRILQLVGNRLVAAFPNEVVARFGGDSFVVLYRESAELIIEAAAGRIIDEFRQPFKVADHDLVVGASIGIAYASGTDTADSLLNDANSAMHQAKRNGRSQASTYDAQSRQRATERFDIEVALRHAIDRDELFVEYQPVISLHDKSIAGVEALVRWEHPLLGHVGPDDFIHVAEESGLIIPIDRWVLDQALRQKVQWERNTVLPDVTMAVNLSPLELLDPTLVASVEAAIVWSGINPQELTLEITENFLMHDIERSITVLGQLKEMGVRLAVDDFGTGHSSMMYLKRLPIDVLKIDRSFVAGLGLNADDSSIVRAISSLGAALDLDVVAEGVETQTQLDALYDLHCSHGQGFLWTPSLSGRELAAWAMARL
jgi:diguanylate cyclase (GGDEF)-like protein/PAS domain S-box-containing protein